MQHEMIVPEGARPGQSLSCIIIPGSARPGDEVIIVAPTGEQMAIDIPPHMHPGELLVVDTGDELHTWTPGMCDDCKDMVEDTCGWCCSREVRTCFLWMLVIGLFCWAVAAIFGHRSPYGYGGYGHGGGYGYGAAQPVHPNVNAYHQHLLSHSNVQYGAINVTDPSLQDAYPGKEDGFERGTNEKGEEIYRYEQNNQVSSRPTHTTTGARSITTAT